jgi:predicted acetyltransferase
MRQIREITTAELDDVIAITANAYPGMELSNRTNRIRYRERLGQLESDPTVHSFALFEDGHMRGVMRWYDFTMNFFGTQTLVGGLGGVAVDLLHKKEKVAADMIRAFLRHYKDAGSSMTALYPFRPDFYRRMGFGHGTPMYHYRFSPASLPKGSTKANLVFLGEGDARKMQTCYERYFRRTHGMMLRQPDYWERILKEPTNRVVGLTGEQGLSGYVTFTFEDGRHDNFLSHSLLVRELIYDTPADLGQLLTFLHTQADQSETISYNTQDEDFFYILKDPRYDPGAMFPVVVAHDSATQGLGIMYRVLDIPRLFEILEGHDFNGVSCRLEIKVSDSFLPENAGATVVTFIEGRAQLAPKAAPEVILSLDVSDFSSLVIGAVGLRKLVEYGLAELSDSAYLGRLERLFSGPRPVCLTQF